MKRNLLLEERRHLHAEGLGELPELEVGDVADSPFETVSVGAVDTRFRREPLLIPALLLAKGSDTGTEPLQGWVRSRARGHAA